MKKYKKILAIGAIIVSLGFIAYKNNDVLSRPMFKVPKYMTEGIEGVVKEEFGTASILTDSSNLRFEKENALFKDLNYGLVIGTPEGDYILSVYNVIRDDKPILALAKAIKPGDTIKIKYDPGYTRIGKDRIGKTTGESIELLKKALR